MARLPREASQSGVYHVMLRGVNRQDIFENDKDYLKFLYLMQREAFPKDEDGGPMPPNLVIYAYCLMPNHVHLLVKEQSNGISDPIKSITISYAHYFNVKYDRVGHMFQDRFRSETVNDIEYFTTLIRYIHQNPVASALVSEVKDYQWSSWREFDKRLRCYVPVCNTNAVLEKYSFDALEEMVNDPLPKTLRVLDIDRKNNGSLDDNEVRDFIQLVCHIETISDVQQLPRNRRNEVLKMVLEYGASIRQLSRVTGVSRGVISNL